MEEVTLIEAPPRHLAIKNRKLDMSNAYDAAIYEFVFRYNLRADGFTSDEIETRWSLYPGSKLKKTKEGKEKQDKLKKLIVYEHPDGNPIIIFVNNDEEPFPVAELKGGGLTPLDIDDFAKI